MNFHVMTLFPEMIRQGLGTSITGKAIDQGTIQLDAIDIRDYSHDEKHHHVDDYPYGGGAGMVIGPEPVYDCYHAIKARIGDAPARVIYMTPQGRVFSQDIAEELSKEEHLIFLCGHYEGIDERVLDEIVTDHLSVGDYVLTGGELPAMVMIDAIARLVPGVLNNDESARYESFQDGLLEYPQYTRPPVYHDRRVPEVLLTGNHAKIEAWRNQKSVERTLLRRPDLFDQKQFDPEGLKIYHEAKAKQCFFNIMMDQADWLIALPQALTEKLTTTWQHKKILDAGYGAEARRQHLSEMQPELQYATLDLFDASMIQTGVFDFEGCKSYLDELSRQPEGVYDYLIIKQVLCRMFPKDVKKAVKRLSALLTEQGHAYVEVCTGANQEEILPYIRKDGDTFIYHQPEEIWKKILGQYFYIKASGIYTYEESQKEVLYFNLHKKKKKTL